MKVNSFCEGNTVFKTFTTAFHDKILSCLKDNKFTKFK